ncbi:4Fe-4S binding protein [Chloroflexota bacterium]
MQAQESRGEFHGVRQDKLKLRFAVPEGKISRRELLSLAWPHYEVIPYIEVAKCRGYRECGLCVDSCHLEAVRVEGDECAIDTALCGGCGVCIEVCPHRAIIYPTFSLEELDKEMEGLLSENIALEPRIIAAVCQRCLPVTSQDKGIQLCYPALSVPCLAMVSPWLMLRAFDMGAGGFALMSGKCRSGCDPTNFEGNVRFVQELFGCWGIEVGRIRVFDVTEADSIEPRLSEFAEEVARLGPTPLSGSEPTLFLDEGLRLPVLVKGMKNKVKGSSKGVVLAGVVPFGKVELDGSRCTGCGLCALDCPTGALTVSTSGESDAYQLLFRHDACVACSWCVDVCPEKCLRLERILDLDRIDSPGTLLFEDSIVRCSECGSPVGTRAMINSVKAKVLAAGRFFSSQFELCPMCKGKAQLSLSGQSGANETD